MARIAPSPGRGGSQVTCALIFQLPSPAQVLTPHFDTAAEQSTAGAPEGYHPDHISWSSYVPYARSPAVTVPLLLRALVKLPQTVSDSQVICHAASLAVTCTTAPLCAFTAPSTCHVVQSPHCVFHTRNLCRPAKPVFQKSCEASIPLRTHLARRAPVPATWA